MKDSSLKFERKILNQLKEMTERDLDAFVLRIKKEVRGFIEEEVSKKEPVLKKIDWDDPDMESYIEGWRDCKNVILEAIGSEDEDDK